MRDIPIKMMALSFCAAMALSTPSLAQQAEANAAAANDAAAAAAPQSDATPQSDSAAPPPGDAAANAEQPAPSKPVELGQGNKAQAEHSAQATANKSVKDPNNQLGTSLQGRTRPVAGAETGPPYDTARAEKPADAAAPDAAVQEKSPDAAAPEKSPEAAAQ